MAPLLAPITGMFGGGAAAGAGAVAAPMAGGFGGLGSILGLAGTFIQARGQMAAAQAQQAQMRHQAAQMELKGKTELAAAQREAEQKKREKKLALSRLQSVSAASGFSASDPTTQDIAGEIEAYGTLGQQMSMFGGKERRQRLDEGAQERREMANTINPFMEGLGTILGGISTFASNYASRPRAPTGGYQGYYT